MARPPLPLGEHGSISLAFRRGLWVARCRFRGLDGVTRHIQKSGKSKTAARLALQEELRAQCGERTEMLRVRATHPRCGRYLDGQDPRPAGRLDGRHL